MSKLLKSLVVASSLIFSNISFGAIGPYQFLSNQPLANQFVEEKTNQVEVLIFFNYKCKHCFNFLKAQQQWQADKRAKIIKIPVSYFDGKNQVLAKLFYSLQIMGLEEKMQMAIFEAIWEQDIDLTKPKVLFDWLKQQKVDIKQFQKLFNSFYVEFMIRKADELALRYDLKGTPFVSIGGKFYLDSGNHQTKLKNINIIINKHF